MSVDYAAGLSDYDDLGVCGLAEVCDEPEVVREKIKKLAHLIRQNSGSCVFHVGAGISTSAGIRDFRGKGGVWTELLAKRGQQQESKATVKQQPVDNEDCDSSELTGKSGAKLEQLKVEAGAESDPSPPIDSGPVDSKESSTSKAFDGTEPTYSHLALRELCERGYVSHIVSQNVDGLFLKANLRREFISELHGNFYLDECTKCRSRFIRAAASETMRLTRSNVRCNRTVGPTSRPCNGFLRDTILDWESSIPFNELRQAERESKRANLHVCMGTTLQLRPSRDLVCRPTKRTSASLVVVNLQPTHLDSTANLVINYKADEVMRALASELAIEVAPYDRATDPTKMPDKIGSAWLKREGAC